jgi:hypothetical protein
LQDLHEHPFGAPQSSFPKTAAVPTEAPLIPIANLVFIAILADTLPPEQRDRARLIGLSLALLTRLGFH